MTYTNGNHLPALPGILQRLGMKLDELGCIMIDSAPVLDGASLPKRYLYSSARPDRSWIRGMVGATAAHTTLKFGLDPRVTREDVDAVLAGWEMPSTLTLGELHTFPSPWPEEEPYVCIVARLDDPALREAHDRLSALPHVDTYRDYTPHLTLAYVTVGSLTSALLELEEVPGSTVRVTALNYGDTIGHREPAAPRYTAPERAEATRRIEGDRFVCDGDAESKCHWWPDCDDETFPCEHDYVSHGDDCWILEWLNATVPVDNDLEDGERRDDDGHYPDGLIRWQWNGEYVLWTYATDPTALAEAKRG